MYKANALAYSKDFGECQFPTSSAAQKVTISVAITARMIRIALRRNRFVSIAQAADRPAPAASVAPPTLPAAGPATATAPRCGGSDAPAGRTAVGQQITWSGTSTANLTQGQLLFSTILTTGGATAPNFVVANRVASITAPVPEPATLTMFGLGALGLVGAAFRRRKLAA